jgi:hypothetical protein
MAFIIPKWQAYDVRDWHQLLIRDSTGGNDINLVTATLINYMPIIGISTLTNKNANDAWQRISIHQALFGSLLHDANGNPLFFTRSDIARHVGIETEARDVSFEEFCQHLPGRKGDVPDEELPAFIANGNRDALWYANTESSI